MHGSMSAAGGNQASRLDRAAPAPPADPTATGPDGNVWFTTQYGNEIGRITPGGVVAYFPVPTPDSVPDGITVGADGNLWFTEYVGDKIGRITPEGTISEFRVPTADSNPSGIAAGPDGTVWFTETWANQIGKIVFGPPAITSPAAASLPADAPGSVTITTTGFPTAAISDGGAALPPGLSFTNNGDGTATISGTPSDVSVATTTTLALSASNGEDPTRPSPSR